MIKWDKPCYKCLSHFCDLSCKEPKHLQAPQPKEPEQDQDEVDIRSRLYQRIHELETQLAQPEQTNTRPYYTIDELNAWADEKEKQAWRNAAIRIGEELSSVGPDGYYDMDAWKWLDWAMEQEPRGKNSLAQPEQEPVAWISPKELLVMRGNAYAGAKDWRVNLGLEPEEGDVGLYTTPPQRTWVGLTQEEIEDSYNADYKAQTRAIEAKLKEKNT